MSTRTPVATDPERRRQASLGGLVPTSAVAREGDTLVMALCVELHAEGAVLPLLVLSDAPGLLGWDPAQGLSVTDDAGRVYEVRNLAQQAGLGALQTAVWIAPVPPPDARTLTLAIGGLVRTSVARGGGGVERPLTGAAWTLEIDLVPARTGADVPAEPDADPPPGRPARVPARTFAGFSDLLPIGQARMAEGAAVCLWALERYTDRAVLTVGTLADDPMRVAPMTPGAGRVEVWDDRGNRYEVSPIHGAARPGWSETSLEVAPAIAPGARAIGVRLADLPGHGAPRGATPLAGPFTFGVAVPPAA
ncbi:hypothetical protein [Miltoncostaea oceani]|uniref:hypothetical protein n=1 Tax=Miltoncostaea oceani TaxID=2843216 RepID=UPI001C3DBC7C|nr:hypothetical protein [Miltoncostaea oceani]